MPPEQVPAPSPAGAGVTSPGQPPFGASPLTMPVPPRGGQSAALADVRTAYDMLQAALPRLGAETEPGQAVFKAIGLLTKIVPPGAVTPGAQRAGMQSFMMQQRQQNPLTQLLATMKQPSGGSDTGAPPPPSAG